MQPEPTFCVRACAPWKNTISESNVGGNIARVGSAALIAGAFAQKHPRDPGGDRVSLHSISASFFLLVPLPLSRTCAPYLQGPMWAILSRPYPSIHPSNAIRWKDGRRHGKG